MFEVVKRPVQGLELLLLLFRFREKSDSSESGDTSKWFNKKREKSQSTSSVRSIQLKGIHDRIVNQLSQVNTTQGYTLQNSQPAQSGQYNSRI